MQDGRATRIRLGYERLVPSVLLPPDDPVGPRPRTARDWVVDVLVVVLAGALGAVTLVTNLDVHPGEVSGALVAVDVALGVLAVLSLVGRRRWPVAVGLLTGLAASVSATASIAASVGLFSVAVHRRARTLVPVLVVNLVATNVFWATRPSDVSWLVNNLLSLGVGAAVVGFGMFVRARRQLVWTLQERAERAEAEQELLTERARAAERARIAREMHDVLGHRLSLLALHAGGLEVRPDLPPAEVAEVAGLLRETSRQALDDLREVIGILREDGSVDVPSTPQPTLADLGRLVDDSRRAGATVSLDLAVNDLGSAPPAAGRVAYRVVQEALTNAAKHAAGAATIIDVAGGPDAGLLVRVRNQVLRSGPAPATPPGAGFGLIGLRERVELAGGTLQHGLDGRGEFVVEARLRWA